MKTNHPVALVTGASSGIGLEIAASLAARRYDLVLVSRSGAKLDRVASTLEQDHGVRVHPCPLDLSVPGSGAALLRFVRERGLEVDVLVNNAGVGAYGDHVDLETGAVDAMLQLNVTSVADLCLLFGREMKARGSGRILNIASTAAYQPAPYMAAYGASKAFVLQFSEALAKELEGTGVTVSCLSPGPTDTGFFRGIDGQGVATDMFGKEERIDARTVAAAGVEAMMTGELSRVVGFKNAFRAWSVRFAPRSVVANISKSLMRSKAADRADGAREATATARNASS